MKKIISIVVVVAMCLALSMTAFAEVDFTIPKEYVLHISYDEVRPGIMVGNSEANIKTPVLATGTTEATFWGWVALAEEVVSFSYSINNGEKVTPADAVVAPEGPVVNAANGVAGATAASRFEVKVPVTEGTQLVQIFANFEDGTSEVFWIAELTVGEASEYDPNAGANAGDSNDDSNGDSNGDSNDDSSTGDNANTGDVSFAFVVVAAALVLTVICKKKVFA